MAAATGDGRDTRWTLSKFRQSMAVGGFLFLLGFAVQATADFQSRVDLGRPFLVGVRLDWPRCPRASSMVVAPVLSRLAEAPLFLGSAALTAFDDNALVTWFPFSGMDYQPRSWKGLSLMEGSPLLPTHRTPEQVLLNRSALAQSDRTTADSQQPF